MEAAAEKAPDMEVQFAVPWQVWGEEEEGIASFPVPGADDVRAQATAAAEPPHARRGVVKLCGVSVVMSAADENQPRGERADLLSAVGGEPFCQRINGGVDSFPEHAAAACGEVWQLLQIFHKAEGELLADAVAPATDERELGAERFAESVVKTFLQVTEQAAEKCIRVFAHRAVGIHADAYGEIGNAVFGSWEFSGRHSSILCLERGREQELSFYIIG